MHVHVIIFSASCYLYMPDDFFSTRNTRFPIRLITYFSFSFRVWIYIMFFWPTTCSTIISCIPYYAGAPYVSRTRQHESFNCRTGQQYIIRLPLIFLERQEQYIAQEMRAILYTILIFLYSEIREKRYIFSCLDRQICPICREVNDVCIHVLIVLKNDNIEIDKNGARPLLYGWRTALLLIHDRLAQSFTRNYNL